MTEAIKLLHSIAGFTIAISGMLQIILSKGGKRHRLIGQVYFYTWMVVILTGGYLGSLLITFFGVLGFYMAITGYRFGHKRGIRIGWFEKSVIMGAIVFSAITGVWGLYLIIRNGMSFGIVALFFGSIFLLAAVQDYREFILKKPIRKMSNHKLQWMFEHFSRMYISYIAAITAFTVIQDIFPIAVLNWLMPTVFGTALIILSNRYYYRKYKIDFKPSAETLP